MPKVKVFKKKICVNVTADCIADGIREDSRYCAIARAKVFNCSVLVNPDDIEFWEKGLRWMATPTARMKKFITDFDRELPVAPTKFYLTFTALKHIPEAP